MNLGKAQRLLISLGAKMSMCRLHLAGGPCPWRRISVSIGAPWPRDAEREMSEVGTKHPQPSLPLRRARVHGLGKATTTAYSEPIRHTEPRGASSAEPVAWGLRLL